MANYVCTLRTNYFHVKDEGKFREFMSHIRGCEGSIKLFEEKDENGETVFGFGAYDCISGYYDTGIDEDEDGNEEAYDKFLNGLQEHVAEDDAVIIMEAGHEKMCYVVGSATVVTCAGHKYLDITKLAVQKAAEMLGNPKWETRCEY